MIRNLKTFGLALAAVLALGAGSASAELGELTSPEGEVEVIGHGSDTGEADSFTSFGDTNSCESTTFIVGKANGTDGEGGHEALSLPSATFTVSPEYSGCKSGTQEQTITMNGCDYVVHVDSGSVDLVCPVGKVIEMHRYSSQANHESGTSDCTQTVMPKTGIGSVTFTNGAEDNVILVEGTLEGITVESHGSCSFGLTLENSEAVVHLEEDELEIVDKEASPVLAHVDEAPKPGDLTSPEGKIEVIGHGSDTGEADSIVAFGNAHTCQGEIFGLGKVNGTAEGEHEPVVLPASEITMSAEYSECESSGQAVTITMNGCDYVLQLTEEAIDLVCPEGKVIEMHRYSSEANHEAGTSNCTTTIKPKTGLGPISYTSGAGSNSMILNGKVGGLTAETHGSCAFGLTVENSEGVYNLREDEVEFTAPLPEVDIG